MKNNTNTSTISLPVEGKYYAIGCLGPYDYNKWAGIAKYTGRTECGDEVSEGVMEVLYEFEVVENGVTDRCYFPIGDIICEYKE